MNIIIGDPLADDVLAGSLFNDSIEGLGGDDVIFANNGDDILDGGDGEDILSGGLGDDTLLGGADDDVYELSAGDDVAFDGGGSDVYIVNGFAGDYVFITDTQGEADTLDFSGGITAAQIDISVGAKSYVDGRVIELSGITEDESDAVELVLLQDLSGSFYDDVATISALKDDLVTSLSGLSSDLKLGLASFVDKPVHPFGDPSSGDYEYATDLALTSDFDAWKAAIDDLEVRYGADGPESQMTALMQVGLREAELGWSDGAQKIVVLTTDAQPHLAGDNPGTPNNGDDVLDGPGNDGTGEDYPTLEQVKSALLAGGIIPIFAVTADVMADYQAIVDEFGFGSVVQLSSDSSDIIEAIEIGVTEASGTVIENVEGTAYDDTITGNDADNELNGRNGDDLISGGSGADLLLGRLGDDTLSGGSQKDRLKGGAGSDSLEGGNGNDLLDGGQDDDILRGGNGKDTFLFYPSKSPGVDTIQDFEDGIDRIKIVDGGALSFADIGVTQDGANLILDVNGVDLAILENTLAASIDASDFIFA